MARITPPEPTIELYQTGFDQDVDLLDRASTGKSLSDLVMRIDDPLVIALDGGWGSGKSFFLKCWVGAHLKDHGGTSQTVYFDAFEHDFIDAPLASLMGVLAERLEPDTDKTGKTVATKTLTALRKAALPLTRLGLAVATYGATEAAGAFADSFINQASDEFKKAAEDFWTRESGQRAAMAQFREALIALTASDAKDTPQKLIIVIDELDRCRPDYALSLLEIIKHFFAVPNVHFVLGVNMKQLENSVHARYGAGIDAGLYLQKFVGLTMRLPERGADRMSKPLTTKYLKMAGEKMGITGPIIEQTQMVLACALFNPPPSLRSIERVLTLMALMSQNPTPYGRMIQSFQIVLSSLLVAKVHAPDLYSKARNGDLKMADVASDFRLFNIDPETGDRQPNLLHRAWANFLDRELVGDRNGWMDFDVRFPMSDPTGELQSLIRTHLETFTLPPDTP